ncbi:MAG: hypothetical protein CL470_08935 [Acidimicrobiaceae bacterium]|nr:hypothetical protein [Acidimicrobiaceae bacterium]
MTSLSIFTTMTNPEERNDPWKEALSCYEDFADEVVVTGKDWPKEFEWDTIGKTFQEGYDLSTKDWVIRMDLDYFFHNKDIDKLHNKLIKYKDCPALSFPQYQIFTPDRYQIKTRICLAFNKKKFPQIKLNGGGDLTLATLNGELIDPTKVPNIGLPIYQYESSFRTKEMIAEDRARFARAWFRYFGEYGDRGGETPEEAYNAWFKMIEERYAKHTFKIKEEQHPKYIVNRLKGIKKNQFAYNAFGLMSSTKRPLKNYIKGYREKYLNPLIYKAANI